MQITIYRAMMDWEDLRYFDAVARAGSLAGGARALGVNHSTAFRRLNRLEDQLGVRLFERHRDGYALTLAGEDMRHSVDRIAGEISELDRRIAGQDLRLTGTLTVTTTDTLVHRLLGPHLAAFRERYPDVELEIVLDSQFLNLSKRQADVALRPTLEPPETLVGRRLSPIAFGIYGSSSYLKQHDFGDDYARYDWLGFDSGMAHLSAARWMRECDLDVHCGLRANNLIALESGAVAGMGLAALPCFMGDSEPKLKRLARLPPEIGSELWILTHADLRNTARVRAFMDFMADGIKSDRPVLEGY